MRTWLQDKRLNGLPSGIVMGAVFAVCIGLGLTGCGGQPQYTFEGTPDSSMTGDDDGYSGNPRDVECFQIEADGQSLGEEDDDEDQQLGTFCKNQDAPQSDDQDD